MYIYICLYIYFIYLSLSSFDVRFSNPHEQHCSLLVALTCASMTKTAELGVHIYAIMMVSIYLPHCKIKTFVEFLFSFKANIFILSSHPSGFYKVASQKELKCPDSGK